MVGLPVGGSVAHGNERGFKAFEHARPIQALRRQPRCLPRRCRKPASVASATAACVKDAVS
ncbi:hypothetical protein NQ024_12485, partial [Corynebacterium sp. 35RC1]|nr:hypothetical protein [Corynebacterium sp. 35RC1]